MNHYQVCVYAITKNEEQFVDRWMDSMQEADLVVVTDTGSTDQTVKKLKARGALVFEESVDPWRFDVARNLSLSHVPDDMDILVCTDLDEVLRPGWRTSLEQHWHKDATMGQYLYNWSLKPDGTPAVQFTYFKVHTKADYTWHCPVHEYLKYVGKKPEKKVFIQGMVLDHFPDPTKSRNSYLGLLEMAVEEDPLSDRMRYYLGREYMYNRRWNECISTLKAFLKLPTATWAEERCAAMRWIAKAYLEIKQHSEAYRWYYRAIAEVPYMRDAYVELAKMGYLLNDWTTVLFAISATLKIKNKSAVYVNAAHAWDYTPDDLMAIACYRLGLYEKSLEHAKQALTFEPENERLQRNHENIKKALKLKF